MEIFAKTDRAFLGRGWSFPPTFSKGGDEVQMTQAEENIKSCLMILLSTTLGERVMQPGYGCNLESQVFESIDTTFSTYITEQIRVAILYNEPRINLETVDYDDDALNGRIDITVNFTILATNKRSNIVYPFYLTEGTDVTQ